jgi:hypothetical protein
VGQGAPAPSVPDAAAAQRTADSIARLSRPASTPTPTKSTTNPTSTKAPVTDPAPVSTPPSNTAAELEKWLNQALDPGTNRSALRRIIADVESMRPNLRGLMLAESWYVEMIARGAQGDTGSCDAARKVKELHTDPSRTTAANITLDDPSCKSPQ